MFQGSSTIFFGFPELVFHGTSYDRGAQLFHGASVEAEVPMKYTGLGIFPSVASGFFPIERAREAWEITTVKWSWLL